MSTGTRGVLRVWLVMRQRRDGLSAVSTIVGLARTFTIAEVGNALRPPSGCLL